MLRVRNLKKTYKDQPVLQGIDMTIENGEFVFLRGASGSGKTTFLKILNGQIRDFQGSIMFNGKAFTSYPIHIIRRKMATIFQSYELLTQKTALENVMLAGEILGRPHKEIKQHALLRLEQVGLAEKVRRFPHELSGGEQQRVAIARALLNNPLLLLADEPTGNLDPETALSIMHLLTKINEEQGITMIIVTHSNELVAQFPNRLITLEKGKVTTS